MSSVKSSPEKSVEQTLKTATSGTSYLILIQLASRLLTFSGNQILLRFLTPDILGIALQLELYSVTVLYFSRESLRVALQRQPLQETPIEKDEGSRPKRTRATQSQAIVNASYIAIGLGIPLAAILAITYANKGFKEVLSSPFFMLSLQMYGFATVLELLSEPAFVLIQQRTLYRSRAASETAAACSKCFSACLAAFVGKRIGVELGVLPFAIGQLAYAVVIVLGYVVSVYTVCRDDGVSLILQKIDSPQSDFWFHRFSRPILALAASMYIQSGVKQLLTQADSVILVALSSLEDQGAFALASNYGGLVARIIFQPIEESSRNAFGALLSPKAENKDSTNKNNLKAALNHLTSILHLYSILAILALTFGPPLLPLLVSLLIGPRWFSPEIATLLAVYATYIPFMAFNGITEAFVSSVATVSELRIQAVWMGGFSLGFAASAWFFLRGLGLGASGLVYANMVNLGLRTIWSWVFIRRYVQREGVGIDYGRLRPSGGSLATGIAIGAYLRSGAVKMDGLKDLVVLGGVFGIGGLMILFFERDSIRPYINHFLPKRLAVRI